MTIKQVVQFIHEVRAEFSKVLWPKFDDFVGSTIIVMVLVCIFAIYLGLVDLGFSKFAKYIFTFKS